MNSRGFLLAEETLKIIVALICITFLVYLLASLYFANKQERELKQAESSLDQIIQEINVNSLTATIYSPKGWYLLGWPFQDVKPNSCLNLGWENCLCICRNHGKKISIPLINTLVTPADLSKSCDELGACREIAQKIVVNPELNRPLQLDPTPSVLSIDYYENNIVKITKSKNGN